jgi:hypothetical protein
VGHRTEVFVGIDTSKSRNAIAIADGGRGGEVRYLGELPATEAAILDVFQIQSVLWIVDCLEAGDHLECDRGPHQLHMRRREWLFRSQGEIRMTCLSDDDSHVVSP